MRRPFRYAAVPALLAVLAVQAHAGRQKPAQVPPSPPLTSSMQPVGAGFGGAVPPTLPSTLDNPNFSAGLRQEIPLTPEQIQEAKRVHSYVNRALATPGAGAPSPMIRTVRVALAAGSHPPLLHLANGNVTTLVFEDKTGAPWPVTRVFTTQSSGITASIVGNERPVTPRSGSKKAAAPASSASEVSNIVALLPTTDQLVGRNVVVTLKGLDVPLAFTVTAGDGSVDYRDDVDVPQYGPGSSPPAASPGMPTLSRDGIQAFLDGVPPSGARKLKCDDASVDAWFWKRQMYVRTHDTLATPSMYHRGSPSGAYVYVVHPTPIISLFHDGAIENVRISHLPPGYAYVSEKSQ